MLALDLSRQFWPLVELVVAILQPAVLLLLCAGVVVASTHLFAMLGTQWGSRRVTGKALIFSLLIHASLFCAVIALVPEYQPAFLDTLSTTDSAVEISSDLTSEATSFDANHPQADPFRQPWERIPSTIPEQAERQAVDVPEQIVEEVLPAPARPVMSPVEVIDPVFNPLPPVTEESSELAKTEVPREYNPAAFQPELDQIMPSEPVQASSRAAPQMARTMPARMDSSAFPEINRIDRRPPTRPTTEIDSGVELDLPSALPSSEADDVPRVAREQPPPRAGPQPAQISDADAGESGSATEQLPQQAAPDMRPNRGARFPLPTDGLAKVERSPASRPQTLSRPGGQEVLPNNQVEPDELGREGNPELMRPSGLSAAPLSSSTPAQYQLRSNEMRNQALEQFGGTAESEAAVDAALKWLASIQDTEGFWDGDQYGAGKIDIEGGISREFAGRDADTGLTALAILAFLGKQNTLEEGEYSKNVERALRWLVYQQGKNSQNIDGYLGGNAAEIAGVYSHAMATFAIAEAYAMTKDSANAQFLVEPLQRAIRFTLMMQLDDGGWRYKRGQQGGGDMSIFGWHLMSLKSAQAAGLEIPLSARQKMILFLQQRGLGKSGGLASYRPNERPSLAMTAESLFCKQMLGLPREHPSCEEAVKFLTMNSPSRRNLNLYSWYYTTLALYQYGGPPWEQWNQKLRELLIAEQVTTGPYAGSWEPRDQWGGYGGRIYSTTFATLTLEVYYRYLPLYRSTAPASEPRAAEPTATDSDSDSTPLQQPNSK